MNKSYVEEIRLCFFIACSILVTNDHQPNNICLLYTECPKKMYTHKANIPYYNVYTSFWDIL
jgi:hypothetical protein